MFRFFLMVCPCPLLFLFSLRLNSSASSTCVCVCISSDFPFFASFLLDFELSPLTSTNNIYGYALSVKWLPISIESYEIVFCAFGSESNMKLRAQHSTLPITELFLGSNISGISTFLYFLQNIFYSMKFSVRQSIISLRSAKSTPYLIS